MRPYNLSVAAIQSSVSRLKRRIREAGHLAYYAILERHFAEYLWSQRKQAGFSDSEADMLRALVVPGSSSK